MKTSLFLSSLRDAASLPLVFRAQESIAPGYHLTEVKRVTYETMDCGAATHRWSETQFELWNPPLSKLAPGHHHMPADKFLQIVNRVDPTLPLNGDDVARVFVRFGDQTPSLYEIESVNHQNGQVWVELSPDRTRCKAAERRLEALTGGCCGSESVDEGTASENPGCGCGATSPDKASAAVACCS